MSGFIYYLYCEDTKRIKIGFTKGNVRARIKQLQTGSASELFLYAVHRGSIEDERALHGRFAKDRVRGEWFTISAQLMGHLVSCALAEAKASIAEKREPARWAKVQLFTLRECLPSTGGVTIQ